MKTAVSLPDDLFRTADAAARELRISRSELYATALSEFLERRSDAATTEQLNKVYGRQSSNLDDSLHKAQLASLNKDW